MKKNYLLALIVPFVLLSACERSTPKDSSVENKAVQPKGWKEVVYTDKFTNKNNVTAQLVSENSQQVGIGSASIKAELIAFKNPGPQEAAGKIWFSDSAMPLGLTHDYGRCYSRTCVVLVKYDDGPIVSYPVFEPPHDSYRAQLIVNSKDFFVKAFKANKIEIRVDFYKAGTGDFIFVGDKSFTWTK